MIKYIGEKNNPYAIVIPCDYDFKVGGVEFLTNIASSQQIGVMHKMSGEKIKPHRHNKIERVISRTQEVLIIRNGQCKISIYDEDDLFIEDVLLSTGDVIFLAMGGHGMEIIDDVSLIEIKQGPYLKDDDKSYLSINSNV